MVKTITLGLLGCWTLIGFLVLLYSISPVALLLSGIPLLIFPSIVRGWME